MRGRIYTIRSKTMAKAFLNEHFKSIHGHIGGIVFYNINGIQYVRSHSIPYNPKTLSQQKNRGTFAAAVKQWQVLKPEERYVYKQMARYKPFSGYNLFISMKMKEAAGKIMNAIPKPMLMHFTAPALILRAYTSVPHYMEYTCSSRVYGCRTLILNKLPDRLHAA